VITVLALPTEDAKATDNNTRRSSFVAFLISLTFLDFLWQQEKD
jgi:hypothetical protein